MSNETRKSIARFIPPQRDKSWSFQVIFHDRELPPTHEFTSPMAREPVIKKASPYLQGHSRNWAMVEFWVKDEAVAKAAAQKLAEVFGLELKDGDFTQEEVF